MKFRETLSFDDITLVPNYSDLISRSEVDLSVGKYSNPIIPSAMMGTSSPLMLDYCGRRNMLTTVHRYFDGPAHQLAHVKMLHTIKAKDIFFAVGSIYNHLEWITGLYEAGIRKFHVDMAHGDSRHCVDTVEWIKLLPEPCEVMAGNVATGKGFRRLEQVGADYIRCGIASGACCSTQINTGIGIPIVTSIIDAVKYRKRAKIIADGGIRTSGDIAKVMALGADFVMVGKLLCATSLSDGMTFDKNRNYVEFPSNDIAYKEYCGMASSFARSTASSQSVNVSIEGAHGLVKYTGETSDVINKIENNLRASLSYVGARTWKDFRKRVSVNKMSSAGVEEKKLHFEHILEH